MPRMLVTRPEHDAGTRYLSHWSNEYFAVANQKGIHVTDLLQTKANRDEFDGRINKINPELVVLNGHGNSRQVTGHDNGPLVTLGDNHHLLKNRITYAVSCESAKELGRACCATDKDTAYIGYEESFIFNIQPRHLQKPVDDKRAGKFLEPSNQVVLSLLKGHSTKEASNRSKTMFRRNIFDLLSSASADPDAREDAKDLFWDMTHQVCLGNPDLKLIQ